jgi:hypothetical protein
MPALPADVLHPNRSIPVPISVPLEVLPLNELFGRFARGRLSVLSDHNVVGIRPCDAILANRVRVKPVTRFTTIASSSTVSDQMLTGELTPRAGAHRFAICGDQVDLLAH